jgi:hypothetical protein
VSLTRRTLVVTAAMEWAAGLEWADMDSRAALGWVVLEWAPMDSAGWVVVSSAAGDSVDLVLQWESIAFLHANIIGSGSANTMASVSANIASQVGMLNIALGVL